MLSHSTIDYAVSFPSYVPPLPFSPTKLTFLAPRRFPDPEKLISSGCIWKKTTGVSVADPSHSNETHHIPFWPGR